MENVGFSFTKKLGLVNGAEKVKFPNNLHLEKLGPNIASMYKYIAVGKFQAFNNFQSIQSLIKSNKNLV